MVRDDTGAYSISVLNMGRPKNDEVIRATNCCNLQRNIVALQVEKRCCTYYHPPQIEAACCARATN